MRRSSPAGAPRRAARVEDQIQRELAEIIRLELRDPRVGLVTLTAIELSRDQSHAKVYFTVLGAEGQSREALDGLEHAAGFLRTQLADRLSTRTVPKLVFAYDESIERGVRLSKLIDEAVHAKAEPTPPAKRSRRTPRA